MTIAMHLPTGPLVRTAADWPAVGVYYDLPPELYYQPELGVASKSMLKHVERSPEHYLTVLEGYGEDTKSLALGRAAHVGLLEPERFDELYVAESALPVLLDEPSFGDCRKKDNKAARDAWRIEHWATADKDEARERLLVERVRFIGARTVLSEGDHDSIVGMRDKLSRHKARSVFEDGHAEVTIRYVDPRTGLTCKSRMDYLSYDGIIADLKTTQDARPDKRHFGKSIADYTYDAQAAFYIDGCRILGIDADVFVFVAVEKTRPYGITWGDISPEDIDAGREIYREAMDRLAFCVKHGEYPGYDDSFVRYELPRWRR